MKTILKLAVLLLAVHALFRFVPPYYHHHRFEAELKDVSSRWAEPHEEEVMQAVLAAAANHSVPIGREDVTIRTIRDHILIDLAYEVPIEWVPSVKHPWKFETNLDVWRLEPPKIPGR